MSGLLGTGADVLQDITLFLEVIILVLLLAGYILVRTKKLRQHGVIMSAAVILHTLTIFIVMVPSFVVYFEILLRDISSPGVIITWVHFVAGTLADVLGIFLVAEWRYRPSPKMTCVKRRRLMKLLLALWILALALGLAFYIYYYV